MAFSIAYFGVPPPLGFGPAAVDVASTNFSSPVTTTGVTTQVTKSTFIVGVCAGASDIPDIPTDSYGNTYVPLGSGIANVEINIKMFVAENGDGGSGHTITAGIVGGTSFATMTVLFLEIANADLGGAAVDSGSNATVADAASPFEVTSGTFAAAGEYAVVMVAGHGFSSGSTWIESTGFSIEVQQNDASLYNIAALATMLTPSTSALTPSFTNLASGTVSRAVLSISAIAP